MIIDFHTHCFNDEIYERAISVLQSNSGLSPTFNGSMRGLKESMAAAGITQSVICNISTNVKQTEKVNDWAIACAGVSGIVPFGSVHPMYSEWRKEIDRLHAAGVKGLKFHPDYQTYNADSPDALKIYEYAAGLNMILLFHTGEDLGIKDEGRGTPQRIKRVADCLKYPRIVAAHMGGWGYWAETEKYLLGADIYLDTSFGFTYLPREVIIRFLEKHGADKFLFGSDAPWGSQKQDVEAVYALDLGKEVTEKVLYRNAEGLLR